MNQYKLCFDGKSWIDTVNSGSINNNLCSDSKLNPEFTVW